MPRFFDLTQLKKPVFTIYEENDNFLWFNTEHDFNTPCSQTLESHLRKKILALSKFPLSKDAPKAKQSSGKLAVKHGREVHTSKFKDVNKDGFS